MIAMIRKTGTSTISAMLAITMLATRFAISDRLRGAWAARFAACAPEARTGRTGSTGARPAITRAVAPELRPARISPEMRVPIVRTSGRAWPDCRVGAREKSMRRLGAVGSGLVTGNQHDADRNAGDGADDFQNANEIAACRTFAHDDGVTRP